MGKTKDIKQKGHAEKEGKSLKSPKIIYTCFAMLFIVGIGLCLYYIFDQTRNEALWSVASEEEIKKESFFNRDCAEVLDNIPNGQLDMPAIEKKMQGYSQSEHGKIFLSGLKAFASVQAKVNYKQDIEFTELIEDNPEIQVFFNYFGSNRSTKREMLYPTLLASDIMVYIFKNHKVIDIHLEDSILSDSDEACLARFYLMAFSVFDYQKRLFNQHYNKSEFYQNISTFDLLALTLYAKAIAATKGTNDKYKINEILTTISQNDFKVGGEKGRWYSWLKKDLKAIQSHTYTRYKITNRPPDVSGRWLI